MRDMSSLTKQPRPALLALELSRAELLELQAATKADGRCGSLQTQDGLPCRKSPRYGWTVCLVHGEKAPQTAAKAERLLALARMPGIEWIVTALDAANEETCDKCGYPTHGLKERKRIDAIAFKLLDRTGFGPGKTLNINAPKDTEADALVERMSDEEMMQMSGLLDQVRQLKERVRNRIARDTITVAALPAGEQS